MRTKLFIVLSLLCGYFTATQPVFAVSLTIESFSSIITDQPFTVDISVVGASAGQNFLRIDLYKDGTSSYFGETSVGTSWNSDSDGTHYVPITIPDTQTVVTASLQGRIGNPSEHDYPGPGSYKLRVRRYTSSGNQGETTQNPVDVQINFSLPTPTQLPTATPTASNTPTPTRVPTPTKTPTPTPTKTPTSTPTSIPIHTTPQKLTESEIKDTKSNDFPSVYPTAVLGTSDENTPTLPQKKEALIESHQTSRSNNMITLVFCGLGATLLCICGILMYRRQRSSE